MAYAKAMNAKVSINGMGAGWSALNATAMWDAQQIVTAVKKE
jgi:hypothetical protein